MSRLPRLLACICLALFSLPAFAQSPEDGGAVARKGRQTDEGGGIAKPVQGGDADVQNATGKVTSQGRKLGLFIAESEPAPNRIAAKVGKSDRTIYLDKALNIYEEDVVSARVTDHGVNQPAVELSFRSAAAKTLARMTSENIGKMLAVVADGKIVSATVIRSKISSRAVVTGDFTWEEARALVSAIKPPPFKAELLLIKASWQTSAHAKKIEVELNEALQDAAVPQKLMALLPESGPQVLFPQKIVSFYRPEKYAQLLQWLKATDLLVALESFPSAETEPYQGAGLLGGGADDPSYSASLVRTLDFLGVDGSEFGALDNPIPFVTQKAVLEWTVNLEDAPGRHSLNFYRRCYLQEGKRGQQNRAKRDVDRNHFGLRAPRQHVAIMHAFPHEKESGFRHAARERGFIALIVVTPLDKNSVAPEEQAKPAVSPPNIVESVDAHYKSEIQQATQAATPEVGAPAQLEPSDPEQVQIVYLKYLDAALLELTLQKALPGSIHVVAEPKKNALLVRATKADMQKAMAIVSALDQPNPSPPATAATANTPTAPSADRVAELRRAFKTSEAKTVEIAKRIKQTQSVRESGRLRGELRKQVERSFAHRQALHRAELKVLEAELQQSAQRIDMRDQLMPQIIDRRVEDLLNPSLRWSSDGRGQPVGDEKAGNTSSGSIGQSSEGGNLPLADTQPANGAIVGKRTAAGDRGLGGYRDFLWESLRSQQAQRSNYLSEIASLEQSQLDLTQSLQALESSGDSKELQRNRQKLDQLEDHLKSMKTFLQNVEQQIVLLEKKLDDTLQAKGLPKNSLDGLVVEASAERAMITLGSDDGLRIGMQIPIFREANYKGEVAVVELKPDLAVCRIVANDSADPIRKGDGARVLLDPRRAALIGDDEGEAIYNQQLKRFKFRLEHIQVTSVVEIAAEFWMQYQRKGHPRISGVWGDPRTNSIIVIGPPECDQAIRDTIAEWEGKQLGVEFDDDNSLEAQRARLQHERRDLLEQLATRQVEIIDAQAKGDNAKAEELAKLNDDVQAKTDALKVLEEKLKVIEASIQRLESSVSPPLPGGVF